MRIAFAVISVAALLGIASCARSAANPVETTDTALRDSDHDAGNWLMYGRTYDDHRFSPLNQINEQTISKLGLVWSQEFTTTRGLEATPLVENGILFTTESWSITSPIPPDPMWELIS